MKSSPLLEPDGLLARATLTPGQREEMHALLTRHFEGVTREQFERDLAEKNWVIEIRREGRLIGFSTLLVGEAEFKGEAITVIYSGDTIVSPEGWGSPALSRQWISAVNHLKEPGKRCHWVLLTSGFRTYRFLPVFWRDFYPRFDLPFEPGRQKLLQFLAEAQYGELFERETGLVRFPRPQCLRGELGDVPEGRRADRQVAFFLERNPGFAQGDELVCLTEICEANLTPAGRRMVQGR